MYFFLFLLISCITTVGLLYLFLSLGSCFCMILRSSLKIVDIFANCCQSNLAQIILILAHRLFDQRMFLQGRNGLILYFTAKRTIIFLDWYFTFSWQFDWTHIVLLLKVLLIVLFIYFFILFYLRYNYFSYFTIFWIRHFLLFSSTSDYCPWSMIWLHIGWNFKINRSCLSWKSIIRHLIYLWYFLLHSY